jgi:hypothetical protein
MTTAERDFLLNAFVNETNGRRLDYPAGKYLGECLSGCKRWLDRIAGRMVAPASGNGWGDGYYSNFPAPLANYFDKVVYSNGVNYQAGSFVIYAKTHHIAIWIKDNGNGTHLVYEQNADPDGSPMHYSNRANSRITGMLPIKITAPPAPTPAPQKGDKPMNDAEENEAYQILLERPRESGPTGRTGIAFMRDARNELAQRRAARDAEKAALIKAAQDAQAEAATTRTALSNAATDLQLKAVEVQEKDKAIAELQDKVKQLTPVVKAPVVPAQVDEKTRGVVVKIFALIQRAFTRK